MRLIINAIMNNNWKNPKEVPEDKFENIIQNKFGIIIAVIMLLLSLSEESQTSNKHGTINIKWLGFR